MAIISTHVHVPRILTVNTIRRWLLFCLELPIVRLLFESGGYARAGSNQRNTVISGSIPKNVGHVL